MIVKIFLFGIFVLLAMKNSSAGQLTSDLSGNTQKVIADGQRIKPQRIEKVKENCFSLFPLEITHHILSFVRDENDFKFFYTLQYVDKYFSTVANNLVNIDTSKSWWQEWKGYSKINDLIGWGRPLKNNNMKLYELLNEHDYLKKHEDLFESYSASEILSIIKDLKEKSYFNPYIRCRYTLLTWAEEISREGEESTIDLVKVLQNYGCKIGIEEIFIGLDDAVYKRDTPFFTVIDKNNLESLLIAVPNYDKDFLRNSCINKLKNVQNWIKGPSNLRKLKHLLKIRLCPSDLKSYDVDKYLIDNEIINSSRLIPLLVENFLEPLNCVENSPSLIEAASLLQQSQANIYKKIGIIKNLKKYSIDDESKIEITHKLTFYKAAISLKFMLLCNNIGKQEFEHNFSTQELYSPVRAYVNLIEKIAISILKKNYSDIPLCYNVLHQNE